MYVAAIGLLAAFGQPVAGLLYESRVVVLALYAMRESWIPLALVLVTLLLARAFMSRKATSRGSLSLSIYVASTIFVLFIALTDRTSSLMIVFLQFRNLFGFVLAIVFMDQFRNRSDSKFMAKCSLMIAIGIITYSFLELYLLLKNGYLLSNDVFNKELLEQVKGTRADVGGGILGAFRIPGPLFNPSQLGIFCVYLIYAGTTGKQRFGRIIVAMLVGVIVLGFSKSAFVMIFMLMTLRVFGRQIGALVVIGFLFSPLILELLADLLSDYHFASIARHFEGYVSAIKLLADHPFGTGVGSGGELASTLGGFESNAGFESGMGTMLVNLGLFGLLFYMVIGLFCFAQIERLYFDLFALWSVSMFFNESALSPHLFVFQFCLAGSMLTVARYQREVPLPRKEAESSSHGGSFVATS